MKTLIKYQININGNGWLSQDGYSKYHERLAMAVRKEISDSEIYGVEQAKEHIKEYYAKQDEYTQKRQSDVLTIDRVTTTIESLTL